MKLCFNDNRGTRDYTENTLICKEEIKMGVFLRLYIAPYRIPAEVWKKVYNETLEILEHFPLLDKERGESGSWYACRTAHREKLIDDYSGWHAVGDMYSGANMENFVLIDDIRYYRERFGEGERSTKDILLSELSEEVEVSRPPAAGVWYSKTQGMPGHMILLAIGCLICHRLPNDAVVFGDITAEQCRKAVEWANQFLSVPIDIPVTADDEKLLPRLMASGLAEEDVLAAFHSLSLEPDSPPKGKLIKRMLPADVIRRYYRKELIPTYQEEGRLPLARFALKEYLTLGLDFADLCRMVLTDPEGNKLKIRDFLKVLLEMKLHVPLGQKSLKDYGALATSGGPHLVDTVDSMLTAAAIAMHGGRNRNVAAYIPLEEILRTIQTVTETENLDKLAGELLEEIEESETYKYQERIYDGKDSVRQQEEAANAERQTDMAEAEEAYNISRRSDVIGYEKGDTVMPILDEALLGYANQLRTIGEKSFCENLQGTSEAERKKFFHRNYRLLIPKEIEEHIFERIMDDEFIVRYVALYSVEIQHAYEWVIRDFLWNTELLDHYWGQTDVPEKE